MPSGAIRIGSRGRTLITATAGAAAALGSGLASAQSSGGGGLGTPDRPYVSDVRCISKCLDLRSVAVGGVAELSGKNLANTSRVKLNGGAATAPRKVSDSRVTFQVPKGAKSGKPVAIDEVGSEGQSQRVLTIERASKVKGARGFSVRSAAVEPSKTFFRSAEQSRIDYLFEAEGRTDVRIDVLKGKRGKLVDSIIERDQEPYANHATSWNGLTEDGKVAPNGKYHFELQPLSGGKSARTKFRFYDHFFPLRGRHTYGDGLGAGRGHQGQDVFARCGKPIKAARGGKVQVSAYHSRAGYYVVIDGAKTKRDYAYMHLRQDGRPKVGQRIKTGDLVGYNSDTGRATGCHLHFELWSGPGWYEGGRPLNATKFLKRWDKWS